MLEKLVKVFRLDDFWSMNSKLALANVKMENIENNIYLAREMYFSLYSTSSVLFDMEKFECQNAQTLVELI